MALGFGEERAYSSIRIGIGRLTYAKREEVAYEAYEIVDAVKNILKIGA